MKDGYYLSAYIDINTQAHILDLEIRHDQNVSLWKKEGIMSSLFIIGNWND